MGDEPVVGAVPMDVESTPAVSSASAESTQKANPNTHSSPSKPEAKPGAASGPSRKPSHDDSVKWVAENQIGQIYGTQYDESEVGAAEKLRTLVNFEITDDKGELIGIDSLDRHDKDGYKGPFKIRGYLMHPVDVQWRDELGKHASSTLNREMWDKVLAEARDKGGEVEANAALSAGMATDDGRLERSLLRVGTDMDGYCNNTSEWTYAKIAEVRGSMVKVHFQGSKSTHDEWVERTSERLAPRGSKLDSGEASLDSDQRPWFEPKLLHDITSERTGIHPLDLDRMQQIDGELGPVEIDGVEDWCMDYTYCIPSLWIISKAGAWYRMAGVMCPGGHLGAPTAAYAPFFQTLTTKFSTCCHMAMVIFDFYHASCKMTIQDACIEITARSQGKIDETHVLENYKLVHDQMCALPRPDHWGKHIKPIDQSVLVTSIPKVGAAAFVCLEETRQRKAEAAKLIKRMGGLPSSLGITAPPAKVGRKSKAEIEAAAAVAAAAGLAMDPKRFVSSHSGRTKETPEQREKRVEEEMKAKILTWWQLRREKGTAWRIDNLRGRMPLPDSFLWEVEFNCGNLPQDRPLSTSGPLAATQLAKRGVSREMSDQIASLWAGYVNFGPLLDFPYLSLDEFLTSLLDNGLACDGGNCNGSDAAGQLMEEFIVRVMAKFFVEKHAHADVKTGAMLPFSFFDKLAMVSRSKTASPAEEEAQAKAERIRLSHLNATQIAAAGARAESVVRRQLINGGCWLEVLRVCVAEEQQLELAEYVDPVHDCLRLLDKLMENQVAWTFSKPVDAKREAPGYLDVVKHPQDLGSIRARIVSGWYDVNALDRTKATISSVKPSSLEAERHTRHEGIYHDVQTVWNNCFLYFNASAEGAPEPGEGEDIVAGSTKDGGAAGSAEVAVVEAARMLSKVFDAGFDVISRKASEHDHHAQNTSGGKSKGGRGVEKVTLRETGDNNNNSNHKQDHPDDMAFMDENRAQCHGGAGKYRTNEMTTNRDGCMYEECPGIDWMRVVKDCGSVVAFAQLPLSSKLALLKWAQDQLLQTNYMRKHLMAAEGVKEEDEEDDGPPKKGRKRKVKPADNEGKAGGATAGSKAQALADASGSNTAPRAAAVTVAAAAEAVEDGLGDRVGKLIHHEVGTVMVTTRVFPLGKGDRHSNRYWVFTDVARTDRDDEEKGERVVMGPAPVLFVEDFASGEWHCYESLEDLTALLCWLDERGQRELCTKEAILSWMTANGLKVDCKALLASSRARSMGVRLLRYGADDMTSEEREEKARLARVQEMAAKNSEEKEKTAAVAALMVATADVKTELNKTEGEKGEDMAVNDQPITLPAAAAAAAAAVGDTKDPVPKPKPVLPRRVVVHAPWQPSAVEYTAPTVSAAFLTELSVSEAQLLMKSVQEVPPPNAASSTVSHVVVTLPEYVSEHSGLRVGDQIMAADGHLVDCVATLKARADKVPLSTALFVLVRRHPSNQYGLTGFTEDVSLLRATSATPLDRSSNRSRARDIPHHTIGAVLDVLTHYHACVQDQNGGNNDMAMRIVPALATEVARMLHTPDALPSSTAADTAAYYHRYGALVELLGEGLMALGRALFGEGSGTSISSSTSSVGAVLMGGPHSRMRRRWLQMVQQAETFSQLSVHSSLLLLDLARHQQ
jgi:hypothetical protein